ncbi:helix-turn-helix domain-containing protein [Sphingobium sp. B11D3A]|uniref:helix-turn-helix domain-containing protein n=1 Tax=Sphingobium sp. B11D3A TaxID=2940574 RepID=UPI0022249949|nr:helix-turn-helix transcriptional regulator [Sphingobium sp. B11D3A]MCW2392264.1 transcriptional regulator with XRE-family HTH domain [Sphingobium sp. B11D3A]
MSQGWVVSPAYRATANAVRHAREAAGVSQRELARRLEKPPSFVNKIELLERRMDLVEFIAIAQALEIEPELFLNQVITEIDGSAVL